MTDITGKTLGKYRLTERLGRGGMAEVYRAYQPSLERDVAIKLMHAHLVEEENFVHRFRREAKSVAALRHPHIVQVYDFETEEDVYYMVMEYVEGETLKERLTRLNARGGRIALDEVARIFRALCDALDYAHGQGCIHRDIKPANIMFDEKRGDRLVLADFGIAAIVGGTRYTASGAVVGTPTYMAPEQGLGEPGDVRSDVYALGVVLYEIVTGRVPFDADTPLAIMLKHLHEPLPLPHQLNAHVPPEVERVILKALAKSTADRYQSAGALADALEAAVKSAAEATKELPPHIAPVTEELPPPAEPTTVAAVSEAVAAPAPPRKLPRWALIGGAVGAVAAIIAAGLFVMSNRGGELEPVAPTPVAVAATPTTAEAAVPAAIEELPPEAVAHYEKGIALREDGNYEGALEEFSQAIEIAPGFAGAYHRRGVTYGEAEQYARAEEDLTKAIALNPNLAEAYYDRAYLYMHRLERYEDALADFTAAIEANPEFAAAYLERARLYDWHFEDYDRAWADLNRTIELAPDLAEARRKRGEHYFWSGEYELAFPDLTRAAELDPEDDYVREMLGITHYLRGEYAEAIARYEESLQIDPTDLGPYYHRAFAHLGMGELDAALADFDKVLLLDEHPARIAGAHYGRGRVHVAAARYEAAIEDFTEALKADEWQFAEFYFPHGNPHLDRALVYQELGRTEDALADLSALIEKDPYGYVIAYYHRGLIYKELGRTEDAAADFKWLWENAPDEEWRGRAEEELRMLRGE